MVPNPAADPQIGINLLVNILRWGIIFSELVYVIFAFIVIRQVALMTQSFKTSSAPLFKLIAFIHFLVSVLVLIVSLGTIGLS